MYESCSPGAISAASLAGFDGGGITVGEKRTAFVGLMV
jgi:hypothetical protein